jgi:hypothetical protein
MFICTVRVRPAPYSIVMTFAPCVMRLIVPSNTQSNRMLVIWQESRGFSDVGRLRSASAAARPAAVSVTGKSETENLEDNRGREQQDRNRDALTGRLDGAARDTLAPSAVSTSHAAHQPRRQHRQDRNAGRDREIDQSDLTRRPAINAHAHLVADPSQQVVRWRG